MRQINNFCSKTTWAQTYFALSIQVTFKIDETCTVMILKYFFNITENGTGHRFSTQSILCHGRH